MQTQQTIVAADDHDRVHCGGFVPRSLKEQFAATARANNRSISGELRVIMHDHVAVNRAHSKR